MDDWVAVGAWVWKVLAAVASVSSATWLLRAWIRPNIALWAFDSRLEEDPALGKLLRFNVAVQNQVDAAVPGPITIVVKTPPGWIVRFMGNGPPLVRLIHGPLLPGHLPPVFTPDTLSKPERIEVFVPGGMRPLATWRLDIAMPPGVAGVALEHQFGPKDKMRATLHSDVYGRHAEFGRRLQFRNVALLGVLAASVVVGATFWYRPDDPWLLNASLVVGLVVGLLSAGIVATLRKRSPPLVQGYHGDTHGSFASFPPRPPPLTKIVVQRS